MKLSIEIVHSYTDNDGEENLYTINLGDQTIECRSIHTAGDIVKEYVTSRLIDDGYY
jgi:hypothetical protein